MNFFKSLLTTILGFFIALFLLFFVFVFIGAGIASMGKGAEKLELSEKSILELDLSTQNN